MKILNPETAAALAALPLFAGIPAAALPGLLPALGATTRRCTKGQVILQAGQTVTHLGVVLAGSVVLEHNDVWGNRTLLGRAGAGELFAETYACLPGEPLLVNAVAAEPAELLFLSAACLQQLGADPHRQQLAQNLLRILAGKNLALARRSLYTAPKTIRGRLLAYFSALAVQSGGLTVTIPFGRQQLADHLGVDRSALCAALAQMQRDGLLHYTRRTVTLHRHPAESGL